MASVLKQSQLEMNGSESFAKLRNVDSLYELSSEQECYQYYADYCRSSTDNPAWTFGPTKSVSGELPSSPGTVECQEDTFELTSGTQHFSPPPDSNANSGTPPRFLPYKGTHNAPFHHQFDDHRNGMVQYDVDSMYPVPSVWDRYSNSSPPTQSAIGLSTVPQASSYMQEPTHYPYPNDYHVMSHTHSQLYMCQETYISCPQSYQTVPAPVAIESSTSVSFDAPKFKLTQERAQPLIKWYEDHKDHPYPNRQEKLRLCQLTQLTYTQVSTWFANARRRNKKIDTVNSSSDENDNN